jgi:hypothetical protein
VYVRVISSRSLRRYDGWKGRKVKETRRINKIIVTEEINHTHKNGILLMFNVRCDLQLAVRNDSLDSLCTSELVLKQRVIIPVNRNRLVFDHMWLFSAVH